MPEIEPPKNKIARWAIFGLVAANLFVWLVAARGLGNNYLEAEFFDVGQGDAAFVQAPGGIQILIDGGPDSGVLEKLGQAMPFYDRDIDWVVLSHPDRDHLGGLLAVVKNYRVHNIVWSGIPSDSAESAEWLDLVSEEKANIIIATAGQTLDLGGQPDLALEILAPAAATPATKTNGTSVVVRLVYGRRAFVFTGDADSAEEQGIIDGDPALRADILKVAHHGSKTSANEEFLADLLPAAAVISVGAGNPYGHPTAQALEMLAKYDIKTLRTDQSGDVVFRTDGDTLFLKTEK
jgi:competence protein ComEC